MDLRMPFLVLPSPRSLFRGNRQLLVLEHSMLLPVLDVRLGVPLPGIALPSPCGLEELRIVRMVSVNHVHDGRLRHVVLLSFW